MEPYIIIPLVVSIAGIAFALGWIVHSRQGKNRILGAEERAKQILAEAEKDANTLKKEKLLEVKDEWYKKKKEHEEEAQSKRNKLQAFEKQIISGEEIVDRKFDHRRFNFTFQSTVRLSLLGSALSADFVTEGRCLIFLGKPGRGKTHLAVALAYRAIQNGFDAVFTTAAQLIDELSAAFREGRLAEALTTYTHPGVLVVDEVGYLTYGSDAANMLFHVVNERHRRRRSMIFTTNKPLAAW